MKYKTVLQKANIDGDKKTSRKGLQDIKTALKRLASDKFLPYILGKWI